MEWERYKISSLFPGHDDESDDDCDHDGGDDGDEEDAIFKMVKISDGLELQTAFPGRLWFPPTGLQTILAKYDFLCFFQLRLQGTY